MTEYVGNMRLMSVGHAETAITVNNPAALVDPTADVFLGHSSEI